MPLTDTQIRTFKPTGKVVKLYDSGGLLLRVSPLGKKCWQFKYTRKGKQNMVGGIGTYPEISLKEAREKVILLRRKLIDGIDPATESKELRLKREEDARTFEVVAREWHEKYSRTWTPGHSRDNMNRLERFLFPALGNLPLAGIRPGDVLEPIRKLEAAGILETAHRACGLASMVFRYAVASRYIESAKKILSWIRRNGKPEFRTQECWQGVKGSFQHMEQVRAGLDVLVERAFIAEVEQERSTRSGRPAAPSYRVHPATFEGGQK